MPPICMHSRLSTTSSARFFRAPEADDDWRPAQCRLLSLSLSSRMHAHSHHPNVRVLRDASYQSPQEAGQVLKSYILNTEDPPAPCARRLASDPLLRLMAADTLTALTNAARLSVRRGAHHEHDHPVLHPLNVSTSGEASASRLAWAGPR